MNAKPREPRAMDGTGAAAADWLIRLESGALGAGDEAQLAAWLAADPAHEAAYARCQAAVLLTPLAADRPGIRWVLEEAAQIAAARPQRQAQGVELAWYQRPKLAWSITGLAVALALLALFLPHGSGRARPDGAAVVAQAGSQAPVAWSEAMRSSGEADASGDATAASAPAARSPVAVLPGDVFVDSRSVAVLPFTATTAEGAPAPQALAAMLNQAVAGQLARLPGFYVADSRTVSAYAGADLPAEAIAAQLGVRGVVQGEVAAYDGRVRLSVSLTDAATDSVSNAAFDEPIGDVGAMPSAVARNIAAAIEDGDLSPALAEPMARIEATEGALR